MATSNCIEAHVRVRPNANPVWATTDNLLYSTTKSDTNYSFTRVHGSSASNRDLYQSFSPVANAVADGRNVTVMAYGQTGSGKTHSMLGVRDDPGLIPRISTALLDVCKEQSGTIVKITYVEIYNETIRDLMNPKSGDLNLREGADGVPKIENVSTREISTPSELMEVIRHCEQHRKYGVTDVNEHSSRSHTILSLEVTRAGAFAGKSTLNLVDLAGSENASKANTEGSVLREGGFINKSLLTLGNVVDAIVEGRGHTPYRESRLTRLLRPCLGGNGLAFIVCCVNPADGNVEQTIASLRFAQRAMRVKNDAHVALELAPWCVRQAAKAYADLQVQHQRQLRLGYEAGIREGWAHSGPLIDASRQVLADTDAACTEIGRAANALLADAKTRALAELAVSARATDAALQKSSAATKTLDEAKKRNRENLNALEEYNAKVRKLETEIHQEEESVHRREEGEREELAAAEAEAIAAEVECISAHERKGRQNIADKFFQGFLKITDHYSVKMFGDDAMLPVDDLQEQVITNNAKLAKERTEVKALRDALEDVRGALQENTVDHSTEDTTDLTAVETDIQTLESEAQQLKGPPKPPPASEPRELSPLRDASVQPQGQEDFDDILGNGVSIFLNNMPAQQVQKKQTAPRPREPSPSRPPQKTATRKADPGMVTPTRAKPSAPVGQTTPVTNIANLVKDVKSRYMDPPKTARTPKAVPTRTTRRADESPRTPRTGRSPVPVARSPAVARASPTPKKTVASPVATPAKRTTQAATRKPAAKATTRTPAKSVTPAKSPVATTATTKSRPTKTSAATKKTKPDVALSPMFRGPVAKKTPQASKQPVKRVRDIEDQVVGIAARRRLIQEMEDNENVEIERQLFADPVKQTTKATAKKSTTASRKKTTA